LPDYIPRILDPNNIYILDCFLTEIQPPFYDINLKLQTTISEWTVFEKAYEYVRLSILTEDYSLSCLEEYFDRYYKMQPEFYRKRYIARKNALILQSNDKKYKVLKKSSKPFSLEPFIIPDTKYFLQARAICQHFCIASFCSTYTQYDYEQKKTKLPRIYTNLFNILNSFSYEYNTNNCIGFNWLNIKIFDSNNVPLLGTYFHYLKSICFYNFFEFEQEIYSTFVHEYSHLIDEQHFSIFAKKKMFNESSIDLFSFSEIPSPYYDDSIYSNNELYQIKNHLYHSTHSEFIKDRNEITYLNLVGKKLHLGKNLKTRKKIDFSLLYGPVSELIKEGIIIDTTIKKFITNHFDYLSDFISSFRYMLDLSIMKECYVFEKGVFSQFLAYDVLMKHSLSLDNIKPEITKENFLHMLLLKIVHENARNTKELKKGESTILNSRLYHYISTIDLYILPGKYLDYMKEIYFLTCRKKEGLRFYSLPGEMLAYSLSTQMYKKSKRIIKHNAEFFNKYISYIYQHSFIKNKSIDYDINILYELEELHYHFEWEKGVEEVIT